MANMSYCRFENTLRNLRDCAGHIFDELSETEERCKNRLIEVCRDIVEESDNEADEDDCDEDIE